MKKLALALCALAAGSVAASAADMAPRYTKAPPAPVVVWSWTGCYIGAAGGGGWDRTDTQRVAIGGTPIAGDWGRGNGSGAVAGGQVGCDYQSGNWVFGIQGQGLWTNIGERHNQITGSFGGGNLAPVGFGILETDLKSMATLTGRIGYTVTPQTLLYVRGGGAWKRDHILLYGPGAAFLSEDAYPTFTGWTFGGGIEYMWTHNVSIFAEGNYADFGRSNVTFTPAPNTVGLPDTVSHHQTVGTVLVGVNFRWGPTAAVVAKY